MKMPPSWIVDKDNMKNVEDDIEAKPMMVQSSTNTVQVISSKNYIKKIIIVILVFIVGFVIYTNNNNGDSLNILTFNMAAINNNPFEYWIQIDNEPAYNKLMENVEKTINNPSSEQDVEIGDIFPSKSWEILKQEMLNIGWKKDFIKRTEDIYYNDFKTRKIITGFLKDKELGLKRLASMPDRVTNTMHTLNLDTIFRPTVINCYNEEIKDFNDWYKKWIQYMFHTKVVMKKNTEKKVIADLLLPISKAKYPAITEKEEEISIPLQTLSAAIFDGILIKMMFDLAPNKWQELRTNICEALNLKKTKKTMEILKSQYINSDIMFLQEVAVAFIQDFKDDETISNKFHILQPEILGRRDQNSVILLSKDIFNADSVMEMTDSVRSKFPKDKKVPVADGDIFSITIKDKQDRLFYLTSFHGDTNGLATIPVVQAVHDVSSEEIPYTINPETNLKNKYFIFGLDANTYEHAKPGKTQDVLEFASFFTKLGLTSVWGDEPDPTKYTTYNARTYLQPQLNKASGKSEILEKGDVNPKDFILFYKNQITSSNVIRDNTGNKQYIENMVIPSLRFPSDHSITSCKLHLQK